VSLDDYAGQGKPINLFIAHAERQAARLKQLKQDMRKQLGIAKCARD
jgi:hypothetical protein